MKQLFSILTHKAPQNIMYCTLTGNVLAFIDFIVKLSILLQIIAVKSCLTLEISYTAPNALTNLHF